MNLLSIILIIATYIGGAFVLDRPVPVAEPPPAIVEEVKAEPVVETKVYVQAEQIQEEPIEVVTMTDNLGISAYVPLTPAPFGPPSSATLLQVENNWALFWALNPDIEERIHNNNK